MSSSNVFSFETSKLSIEDLHYYLDEDGSKNQCLQGIISYNIELRVIAYRTRHIKKN